MSADRDPSGDVRTFESVQRLDPDAFEHAKSRVDGGFDAGVEAFVTDEQGRVLLVCEDGRWALPGGEVNEEQAPEPTLADAVANQAGLDVTVGERVAVNEVTLTDGEREATLSFDIYRCSRDDQSQSPEAGADGVTAAEWHADLPPATIDRAVVAQLRNER